MKTASMCPASEWLHSRPVILGIRGIHSIDELFRSLFRYLAYCTIVFGVLLCILLYNPDYTCRRYIMGPDIEQEFLVHIVHITETLSFR